MTLIRRGSNFMALTNKIGHIKNPLTIIAIFAGIAEVSGTIVLPFILTDNQELFIWFLISFPSILILLFFITLNFNSNVLYAPSDFEDETNYIKVNKFDIGKQENVEFKVHKFFKNYDLQLAESTEKINKLSNIIYELENKKTIEKSGESEVPLYVESFGFELLVSDFPDVNTFIDKMNTYNLNFSVYNSYTGDENHTLHSEGKAIWLGINIPIDLAKFAIKHSKDFYPHLKYIKISDEWDPDNDVLYIGGSTNSAVNNFRLTPLSDDDFEKLQSFSDINSLHNFIKNFNK